MSDNSKDAIQNVDARDRSKKPADSPLKKRDFLRSTLDNPPPIGANVEPPEIMDLVDKAIKNEITSKDLYIRKFFYKDILPKDPKELTDAQAAKALSDLGKSKWKFSRTPDKVHDIHRLDLVTNIYAVATDLQNSVKELISRLPNAQYLNSALDGFQLTINAVTEKIKESKKKTGKSDEADFISLVKDIRDLYRWQDRLTSQIKKSQEETKKSQEETWRSNPFSFFKEANE